MFGYCLLKVSVLFLENLEKRRFSIYSFISPSSSKQLTNRVSTPICFKNFKTSFFEFENFSSFFSKTKFDRKSSIISLNKISYFFINHKQIKCLKHLIRPFPLHLQGLHDLTISQSFEFPDTKASYIHKPLLHWL